MSISYKKPFAISKNANRLGLKKTEKRMGVSFSLECAFYETKYENIYITDYDTAKDEDLEKRGLVMLYHREHNIVNQTSIIKVNKLIITSELLDNDTEFNNILDNFKNECVSLYNKAIAEWDY